MNCVSGVKIKFFKKVYQNQIPTVRIDSKRKKENYDKTISTLFNKGIIEYCKPCKNQFLSSYFLVPKSDGSFRFILNLKALNKFIDTKHFKMEGVKTASELIFPGNFMGSIDLQDAYFLVPIHWQSKKFLRFEFAGKLYQFTCLPMGLSSCPLIFTKIMNPVVKYLRLNGFVSVKYLDDILCIGETFEMCAKNIEITVALLQKLGFIINYKKSNLIPSTRCKYLGFIFDSNHYTLELTLEKREKLLTLVNKMLKKDTCSIQELAILIGSLVAACPAVEYGFLYTKLLEKAKCKALLNNGNDYNAIMRVPNYILEDLNWWKVHLQHAVNPIKTNHFEMELFSDASGSGWGATNGKNSVFGFWNKKERKLSINYRELLAVKHALCKLAKVSNKQILLRVDNTTAIAYDNKMGGTRYTKYHTLAKEIWQWAEAKHNFLFASYINTHDNVEADELSRIKSADTEWELNNDVFNTIVNVYGYPDIDLFASYHNAKCDSYCSWFPDKYANRVNAFTFSWSNVYFYAFPPFNLILKTLVKIKRDKASGVIVVPDWQNQPWYPLFLELLIDKPLLFGPNDDLILSPNREQHPRARFLRLMVGRVSTNHSN